MKNKKIMLLLTIMLSIFMLSGKVNALKIHQRAVDAGGNVVKVYDNEYYNPPKTDRVGLSRMEFLTILSDQDNELYVGYCIEFGNPLGLSSGSVASGTVVTTTPLKQFLTDSGKTDAEATEIVNYLRYLYYFGYNKNDSSRNSDVYYLATQALMWEYLGSKRLYVNMPIDKAADIVTESEIAQLTVAAEDEAGEGVTVKFNVIPTNIRFWRYGSANISSGVTLPTGADLVNITTAKNKILGDIEKYKKIPSFSDEDLDALEKMVPGQVAVLTADDEEIISNYTVQCTDGVIECKLEGDKLTVEAKSVGTFTIKLTRKTEGFGDSVPSMVYQLKKSDNNPGQGVVVVGGNLSPVVVNYYGEVVEAPLEPACYVCGTGDDQEYFWGTPEDEGFDETCKLKADINDADNCKYSKPSVAPQTSKPTVSNPQTSGLRIAYISLVCGIAAALGFVYFYSKKPENE